MSVTILTGKAARLLRLAAGWRRVAARCDDPEQRELDLGMASLLFERAMAEGGGFRVLTGKAARLVRLAAGWRRVAARCDDPEQRKLDLAMASWLFHRAMSGGAR